MNLNEVEKHVKFDIVLNLLIYIAVGLCLLLSIIVILATPAKAAATNINSYSHSTCNSSMGSSSQYGVFTNNNCYSKSIGTTYNGVANLIGFWLNYNFTAGKYYTFTINFKDNDLLSSTIVDVVRVIDVAHNRQDWSNTYTFVSKKQFKVSFMAPTATSSLAISISSGSGDPITGVSNYGISSITLDDNDSSDEIITNATENTNTIINNANSNTLNIIEKMQTILEDCYRNYMTANSVLATNNMYHEGNDFQQQTADTNPNFQLRIQGFFEGIYMNTLVSENITTTGRHSFMFMKHSSFNQIVFKTNGYDRDTGITIDVSSLINDVYYYISADFVNISQGHYQWRNMMISHADKPFISWGTQQCNSKIDSFWTITNDKLDDTNSLLDNQNDLQQEQNDYLMDDTNPSVDSSAINGVISDVTITDPLNYLLTLPLSLLNKLNQVLSSNSCQRVSFGTLYNTELYLPCINFEQILGSALWGTIDLITGVGLLAVILKRFYDSISNMLTLGKEKEVRDKLDLPTPMQFLASILGGGRD